MPVRTCVVCRGKSERAELIRLAVDPGSSSPRLVLDLRKRLPGRGVWCHEKQECLFARKLPELVAASLKRKGAVKVSGFLDVLNDTLQMHERSGGQRDKVERLERLRRDFAACLQAVPKKRIRL